MSAIRDVRCIGQADIWVLPIYWYQPKWPLLSASVGVDKTQITCARKHNEPRRDSYLAAMLAGAFS